MNTPLRVAVVGAGRMGADHIERIHRRINGAEIAAVVDIDRARAEAAIAHIPGAVAHTDFQEVLDRESLHAVEPELYRRGRSALYDARATSSHGDSACASCFASVSSARHVRWSLRGSMGRPFSWQKTRPWFSRTGPAAIRSASCAVRRRRRSLVGRPTPGRTLAPAEDRLKKYLPP